MEINIQPVEIIYNKQIDNIRILIQNIDLNVSASFAVFSYFGNEIIKGDYVVISGEEYQNWQSDDGYVIDLICQKLGYQKIN
jgi:hypothetical protein